MSKEELGLGGPGSSLSELEHLRKRLYAPGASSEDIAAYRELESRVGGSRRAPIETQLEADSTTPSPQLHPDEAWTLRSRVPRARIVIPAVLVLSALIVLALLPPGPPPLPAWVNPPSAPGTTITTLARETNPAAAPNLVTYQPQGYTVFQPKGHAVRVRIRCQGTGTVSIAAGRRFTFRCAARQSVQELVGRPIQKPFLIIGTTRGNVVWAARIAYE